MNYTTDVRFETPKELLDFFLNDSWFRTDHIFQANFIGKAGVVFRGQSNADWKLLPSAFRSGALKNFTPQPPDDKRDLDQIRLHLGLQLHAESRAVYLFVQAADDIGIPTPIDYENVNKSTELLNAAFNDVPDYNYGEQFPPISFQREVALAQHHGVPTRFLDWTESPLVACYFAAYGASVFAHEKPTENQDISIVFMTSYAVQRTDGQIELIRAPKYENSHLLQQHGLFSSIRNANNYFLEKGEWPSMEDYITSKFQIHRRCLPASQADNLLKELFDLNITRLSLMPTLNNAANHFLYAKKLFTSD